MQIVGTVIDKTWIVAHKAWLMIPAAVMVAALIFAFLSIRSCQAPPVTPIAAINTLQTELEKPLIAQIKAAEKLAADYKSRLLISEERSKVWENRYVDLEKRKRDVKPPVTNAETRTRYIAAGFTPLPVK